MDCGDDSVEALNDTTMYVVPSIHKLKGEAFHYAVNEVHRI